MFIVMSLHQSTADLKNRREAPWKHRQIDCRNRKRHQQPPKRRLFSGWMALIHPENSPFMSRLSVCVFVGHLELYQVVFCLEVLCVYVCLPGIRIIMMYLFDQLSVAVFGGSRRRMISVQLVRCYSKQIHWVVVDRHRGTCHERS